MVRAMALELLFFAIILGSYLVPKGASIRCYTCGEKEESCLNFQLENPRFNKECDPESTSCSLTRKANENVVLSRSCNNIKLNDCKTANSIEYCFCTQDLCNQINPLDDEEGGEDLQEDLVEGSGDKSSTITTTTISTTTSHEGINVKLVPSSSCSALQCSKYFMGLAVLNWYFLPKIFAQF